MTTRPERPFALDRFQREAVDHLDDGKSVVVAAPTGAGKTVVAEHAVLRALEAGRKAFYTTPIKALSNQKYHDFARLLGAERVGLLTGDTSINGESDVVVMTTEVLRNMIYGASPTLRRLGCVVLDEVHYLQDPYRGPVWEEVLVHTPADVQLVCLSATVSNADELTEWISTVRGPTELVVEHRRPVGLDNLFMVADTESRRPHLIPLLLDDRPNPEGHRFSERARPARGGRRDRERRRFRTPRRHEVLERLRDRDMLPAIVFVFSRAGCDDAVAQLVADGVMLTDDDEIARIEQLAASRVRHLGPDELDVLRFDRFVRSLRRGVAAHHAGMVPAFKEIVEACFVEGLVKLVFATETLALGINMPARAVVIERLSKFNGDTHQFLTPMEYTQLTGRAGRRGIDERGFAIVLWSPFATFEQVADLASSRSFGLRSVFRPTYNMAVNLISLHDRDGAHELLDRSFGQFQADHDVARLDQRRRRLDSEVRELERELRDADVDPHDVDDDDLLDRRAAAIAEATAALRPGEVIAVATAGGAEPAVVLSVAYRGRGTIRVRLVTRSATEVVLDAGELTEAPAVLATIELPTPYLPDDAAFQQDVARRLARARLRRRRDDRGREQPAARPPDRHGGTRRRLAERRRQLRRVEERIRGRSSRLAGQFDDIVGVLQSLGYVAAWELNPSGQMLRGIFHECDLAVAEAIRLGVLDDLDAAELAAIVSCFTYEHRGPETVSAPRIRSRRLRDRMSRLDAAVADLQAVELEAGVRLTRDLDAGFMATAAAWAGGEDLGDVLDDEEITGGDFVRQVRQLVDLLRQIATVSPTPETAATAHRAADALNRGIVVASIDPERSVQGSPP